MLLSTGTLRRVEVRGDGRNEDGIGHCGRVAGGLCGDCGGTRDLRGAAVDRAGTRARADRGRVAQLAALCVIFAAVVGWNVLWERFGQRDLYGNRKQMTLSAVAMARERPAAGWGMGTFQYVYPAYALFDDDMLVNHAHNDWAEWTAEGGLPFLAFMLAVAAWSVSRARRVPWAVGIPAVLAHCLVDYNLQNQPVALCFFLLLGSAAACGPAHGLRDAGREGRARAVVPAAAAADGC